MTANLHKSLLMWAGNVFKYFICIISLNPHNNHIRFLSTGGAIETWNEYINV